MEALQWCGTDHIVLSGCPVGWEEIREEEEEAFERLMVSTGSFMQGNLHHSIAAFGIHTRTVGVKVIDMGLE